MSNVVSISSQLGSKKREVWIDDATDTLMESLESLRDAVFETIEEELSGHSLAELKSGSITIIPILDIHVDAGEKSLRRGLKLPSNDGGSAA